MGDSLAHTLANKTSRDDEVHCYRRDMAKFLKQFEENKNKLPEHFGNEPLPESVPSSLNVVCHLPGDKDKTIAIDGRGNLRTF